MSTHTTVQASTVKVGDTLALFGPEPSALVTGVQGTITQGARYRYTFTLDDGSTFDRMAGDTLTLMGA